VAVTKPIKITIIGGGNAGCLTALHFGYHSRNNKNISVELLYDPSTPPEKVGQATLLEPPKLLWQALGMTWYNNSVDATLKLGILYENWGKKREKLFHPFPFDSTALHYTPSKLQKTILKSGYFSVQEKHINDYEQINSDYIFDCRGTPDNWDEYEELENPINAVILAQDSKRDLKANWTRAVATPDGWCFIIPNTSSTNSYGYLYNHQITSDKNAKENFEKLFKVESTDQFKFKQYVAKNPIIDDRIILNGNRLFFLEPLEATAIASYIHWLRMVWDWIIEEIATPEQITSEFHNYVTQVKNFIIWHYQYGSKYDTPFWEMAGNLKFKDPLFDKLLEHTKESSMIDLIAELYERDKPNKHYGTWDSNSFKYWYDGMTKEENGSK
jgi:hypothetical protein